MHRGTGAPGRGTDMTGALATGSWGEFADPEVEARFQIAERGRRAIFVRIYAAIAIVMMLAYAVINPLFFNSGGEVSFSLLLGPALLVLAAYAALSWWPGYASSPIIDFACLLGFAILVTGSNLLIYGQVDQLDPTIHAAAGINRMVVSAFAAVVLAGQRRWFLSFAASHALFFTAVMAWVEPDAAGLTFALLSYAAGMAVVIFINAALERSHRSAFALGHALDGERARNEELLFNVLPPVAAQRLKDGLVVADSFSDASVVFIDVVGFSLLAKKVSPGHLIEVLNGFFSLADRCAAESGVEKVKTIGDAYLAISGGNAPAVNSADAAIRFGEAVIAGLPALREETGIDLHVRVGIHSGPVVGGVIGTSRMAYDYWGETMNIASRIEGAAQPDGIAVSEATMLRARGARRFAEPETMLLKGVGEMAVYRLEA